MPSPDNLYRRRWAERRFHSYGILALLIAGSALMFLVWTIVSAGHTAFYRTLLRLDLDLDPQRHDLLLDG